MAKGGAIFTMCLTLSLKQLYDHQIKLRKTVKTKQKKNYLGSPLPNETSKDIQKTPSFLALMAQ